jgi:lipopolysaccharide biosynthesis glycosyltransferase
LNAICTVIAANYLPQALTLEESVSRNNPEEDFFVLIIDGLDRDLPVFKHAKILLGSDLEIDKQHFKDICTIYDLFEASTAIKPTLFKTLLNQGYKTVTFLDPDTQLFGSLDSLFEVSERYSIVLTPHRLTPVSENAVNQKEESFLRYGTFNLGFISVNQNSMQFLDWWEEKLHWSCRRYSGDIVYTDQKWIDLVPSYFDYFCLRDPGYNLAPWNLDERELNISPGGELFVNANKLVFIHYSQMSSTLAKGMTSNLWDYYQEGLDSNKESLKLARNLTGDYAKLLLQNKSLVNQIEIPKFDWGRGSFHLRAFLISLAKGNKSKFAASKLRILRMIDPLVARLERADTFNSLFDGIQKDFRRLKKKLSS